MKTDHNAIGDDEWVGTGKKKGQKVSYRTADTKDFEKLMKSKDDFLAGSLSGTDFEKLVNDALSGNNKGRYQNIDTNNSFFKDMLTEMQQIMATSGSANAARNAMMQSATLNISNADVKAKAHDAINDTAKFGTFQQRQEFRDAQAAKAAVDKNIEDVNKAWDGYDKTDSHGNKTHVEGVKDKYSKNIVNAAADPKAAMDALNKAIGDKFKQANEELARSLKNEGIKVKFGEDQKFKINDQPILAALNKIKEAQDKANKEKADAAAAGETNKLLADMLKELKKKK